MSLEDNVRQHLVAEIELEAENTAFLKGLIRYMQIDRVGLDAAIVKLRAKALEQYASTPAEEELPGDHEHLVATMDRSEKWARDKVNAARELVRLADQTGRP